MENRFLVKGKRKDGKGWIIGYYIPMQHNDERTHIHHFIMPLGTDMSRGRLLEDCLVEVEGESVGQCTGLTDKNGTLIFEGDILKDTGGWVYEVKWDADNGRWLGHHSKPRGDTYICYVGREPKSTIIGSVHDDPELLEVEA